MNPNRNIAATVISLTLLAACHEAPRAERTQTPTNTPTTFVSTAVPVVAAPAPVQLPLSPVLTSPLPTQPSVFTDADFVQATLDGHLQLNGQRVRDGGWIGHFLLEGTLVKYRVEAGDSAEVRKEKVDKARQVFDALAQRIHDTGFNLVRMWEDVSWSEPYTIGDGSRSDLLAFSFAALEKRGIKVWVTGLNALGVITPEDVNIIDEPATAAAWTAAITEAKNPVIRGSLMRGWDSRTTALMMKRAHEVANWPNHYKGGLRLADDPQMAIWELSNEDWWASGMLNGHWQELPKFFRDGYQAKWIEFLKKTYGTNEKVIDAWGFLLPGESLEKGNIVIINPGGTTDPKMVNDANPAALAALTATAQAIGRDQVTRQRTADVVRFVDELQISWKTAMRDGVRTMGRATKLSPIVLDTGDGYRIQAIHLHQHGDASAMCTYLWQTGTDRQQPHFPWVSGLEEAPRLGMGIPWAEVGKIPNKPFFIYEIQTNNPDKYRAEFPYRIAAAAAIQDWDVVNFHLFGRPNDPAEAEPYSKSLAYSHPDVSIEGVHFKNDEIYTSALKAAGTFFTTGALKTVDKPTVMTFGSKSLYDPVSADYGKAFGDLGKLIMPTAYRYGVQMQVDPMRTDDHVEGPTIEPGLMHYSPLKPTEQITFDWSKGSLTFDTPNGVSFAGFLGHYGAKYTFTNGVSLSNVTITNPPGMSYPVGPDELYVAFSTVAQDGQPLATSKRVLISLVSTSFNTGYKINEDNVARGDLGYTGKPFAGQRQDEHPQTPVTVARVGGTLTASALKGMHYRFLDWHFREIGTGTVGESLSIPADKPVFITELTR